MLDLPDYARRWELKKSGCADNGILPADDGGGANGVLIWTYDLQGADAQAWLAHAAQVLEAAPPRRVIRHLALPPAGRPRRPPSGLPELAAAPRTLPALKGARGSAPAATGQHIAGVEEVCLESRPGSRALTLRRRHLSVPDDSIVAW